MKKVWVFSLIWLSIASVQAANIAGVNIDDAVIVDQQKLTLNGAGVRTKFFFDIYVGALFARKNIQCTTSDRGQWTETCQHEFFV